MKWGFAILFSVIAYFQLVWGAAPMPPAVQFPDLYEASVMELQAGLDAGHFTSVDLVKVRRFLCHS